MTKTSQMNNQDKLDERIDTSFARYAFSPQRASTGYVKLVKSIRENNGISFGPALEKHVIPARPGKVFNIMARPGHCKTTLMSVLCAQAALRIQQTSRDGVVVYATWETPIEELEAFFQPKDGFDVSDLAWGKVDVGSVSKLTKQRLDTPIWTVGTSLYSGWDKEPMTVDQLFEAILGIEKSTGKRVEACFVDYIQAIYVPDENDRYNQVTRAARLMRQLSIQAKVPVILGVQANQRVDDSVGRYPVPRLRDAEWSSVITQDADTVLALWRPIKQFDPRVKPTLEISGETYRVTQDLLVVDILKQRWENGSGRHVMSLRPDVLALDVMPTAYPSENMMSANNDSGLFNSL